MLTAGSTTGPTALGGSKKRAAYLPTMLLGSVPLIAGQGEQMSLSKIDIRVSCHMRFIAASTTAGLVSTSTVSMDRAQSGVRWGVDGPLFQRGAEFVGIDGLGEEVIHSGPEGSFPVFL